MTKTQISRIEIVSLFAIFLMLVPYVSNGFWFDDALNSQLYYQLSRTGVGLADYSQRVFVKWLYDNGRLMFGYFYGFPLLYIFHDLFMLRMAHCISVLINILVWALMLKRFGMTKPQLSVWAVVLVGLFQINSLGLDPVGGFAFHYQFLGIELALSLWFFSVYLDKDERKYLYLSLGFWLFFMLSYEINILFIPIIFGLLFLKHGFTRKYPYIVIGIFTSFYLILYFAVKSQATASYAGTEFGHNSKFFLAYIMQLTGTFPFSSYLFVNASSINFLDLLRQSATSILSIGVFVTGFIAIHNNSKKDTATLSNANLVWIAACMFFLPAIFPAISERYQNEVKFGAPTLPVYYQNFGLAYVLTLGFFRVSRWRLLHTVLVFCFCVYMACNLILNQRKVDILDNYYRMPRDVFSVYAPKAFTQVRDGDIIVIPKGMPHYITADLIYQYTGKNIYVPSEAHTYIPESPSANPQEWKLTINDNGYILIPIKVLGS